ncbi:MAG: hypothetical protein NZ518_00500 [Dehalococcoidia bacterium]|nr:hypothetical protein [Dehalococcoidia bacterium]
MDTGLLWYEPSRGTPLVDRVDSAAQRYVERYGVAPNLALVAVEEYEPLPRITVRADRRIRPGHLLIGVEPSERGLRRWQPERRSSDDIEVALLNPDGSVRSSLRPQSGVRSSGRKKAVAR